MTHNTLLVLRALTAAPDREMYGLEIMRAISLPSGTVYPLLDRAVAAGWVTTRAEDISPQAEGRPRRKYYQVTTEGEAAARAEVDREAALLAALGVTREPPETGPLNIGGIKIGLTVDPRQPPGIVSVVSAGLDGDGKPVVSAAHMDIGAGEAGADSGPCVHRIPPGSFCVRCARLIGGLRLDHELSRRPSLGSRAHGEPEAPHSVDVGRAAESGRREPGVLGVLAGRSRPPRRRVRRTRPGGYCRAAS
jgi:PadR family transcriptional regulator, regulatory protein PadR